MGRLATFLLVYPKLLAICTLVGLIPLGIVYAWQPGVAIALWVIVAIVLIPTAWRFDDAVRASKSTGTFGRN